MARFQAPFHQSYRVTWTEEEQKEQEMMASKEKHTSALCKVLLLLDGEYGPQWLMSNVAELAVHN